MLIPWVNILIEGRGGDSVHGETDPCKGRLAPLFEGGKRWRAAPICLFWVLEIKK